jgi:hypothetical protein
MGDEHQRHRPVEVEGLAQLRAGEDRLRLAEVGVQEPGRALGGADHQGPRVGEHERVAVDVEHPRGRPHGLHDLVQVGRGGDAGADVEELVDPGLGQVAAIRRITARLACAMSPIVGSCARMASPSSRSGAKLSLPPSQ